MSRTMNYTHMFLYIIMRLYADLHFSIIDYRQFLHILPIYCELSDNLKKDFLLLLYHIFPICQALNVRSTRTGRGQKYYNIFLTKHYKQNIIIFY